MQINYILIKTYQFVLVKLLMTLDMKHQELLKVLKEEDIFERVIAIKYDVPKDKLEMFDDYMQAIDQFYDRIMEKNA